MRCEAARNALLEADEDDLRACGSDALSEHLRGCVRCARIAEKLLERQRELAVELAQGAAAASRDFVDRVLEQAGVSSAAGNPDAIVSAAGGDAPREAPAEDAPREQVAPPGRGLRRVRPGRLWASALAAAAVASLLLWPDPVPPVPATESTAAANARAVPRIDPPPGRTVAVMKTANPSITVVWLLEGGE